MWKPLLLIFGQVGLFFSFVMYIGLDGNTAWIVGTVLLVLSIVAFWASARAINKQAA